MDEATEETVDQQCLEGRSLLVLYASETGKSQEVAEEIGDVAERMRFPTMVAPMNAASLQDLALYSLVIFVVSTTGQGDLPANATIFWKSLLRKKLPTHCLSQVHFALFGLGDSSYEKFNWAARKFRKRILQLGANESVPFGEGDERHDNGIDSIYLPWFQGLKAHLLREFPLPPNLTVIPDDELLPPKYPIVLAEMDVYANDANETIFIDPALQSQVGSVVNRDEHPAVSHLRNPKPKVGWEANRDKSAALSHLRNPKTLDEELDDQERRFNAMSGLGQLAREDGDVLGRITGSSRHAFNSIQLDKDNILKDHPEDYGLDPSAVPCERTSTAQLPIPDTWRARVLSNERLTPEDHWQDVRNLQLELLSSDPSETLPRLKPGDVLTIFPKNFPAEANRLIDMMNWQDLAYKPIKWAVRVTEPGNKRRWADTRPGIKRHDSGATRLPNDLHPLPRSTLRDLLIHNLDINAIPNRTFLKQLRRHTQDDREKERLLELTLEENTQEFYDYTSRPRRTILEVLEDFPGVQIPFEYALDIFPLIRGRAFSIANSDRTHRQGSFAHKVELLVALVEYKTIIRKPRQGLCSRYIKSLLNGTELVVDLARTNAPPSGEVASERPLIAIATGTGIAPIRSLLQERRTWNCDFLSPELLFFGCRSRKADYYFEDEWEKAAPKLQVIPAFSRDPISPALQAGLDPYTDKRIRLKDSSATLSTDLIRMGPIDAPWMRSTEYDKGKMYVQHQIRQNAHEVCEMLKLASDADTKPIIMICGNAGRMPISVRHALTDALVLGGMCANHEAAKTTLQDIGIWMETW